MKKLEQIDAQLERVAGIRAQAHAKGQLLLVRNCDSVIDDLRALRERAEVMSGLTLADFANQQDGQH